MRFGVMLPQNNSIASADGLLRAAEAADELGFDTISVRDHIVFNGAWITAGMRGIDVPGGDDRNIFESLLSLAFVASRTTKVRLGTSVIVLPNRHPVLFAKQIATLDVLSRGRVLLGLGVGPNRRASASETTKLGRHRNNLEKEYDIFGAVGPRGQRMEEYVRAAIAIWTEPRPSFHGEYVDFDEIDIFPKPIQKPYPPIIIGGRSTEAKRRAARLGDGWNPSQIASSEIPPAVEEIRKEREAVGRDPDPGLIGINVHSIIAGTDQEAEDLVTPTIGHMFADRDQLWQRTIIGTVETFTKRVLEYKASGVNFVELKPVYRSIDHLIDQMRLIHDEVMPRV